MNIRQDRSVVAFYTAARNFCQLLEAEAVSRVMSPTSVFYALRDFDACSYLLPEPPVPENVFALPDEFAVTELQRRDLCIRLSSLLGAYDGYWDHFHPTLPPNPKREPVFASLSAELTKIYGDVLPGVRAWESQRDPLLSLIVFGWKRLCSHSQWHSHSDSIMRALFHIPNDMSQESPNAPLRTAPGRYV